MNIFDLRNNTDHDDWELGLRVACALYAENVVPGIGRYDIICHRAYEAARQRRTKERKIRK